VGIVYRADDSTTLGSECISKEVIANAVRPLYSYRAGSPNRSLAIVRRQLDYDAKDAEESAQKEENHPSIDTQCHRAANRDSVCRRYNFPSHGGVEGASCICLVHREERQALEIGIVACNFTAVGGGGIH
jgi:hypothetical protein